MQPAAERSSEHAFTVVEVIVAAIVVIVAVSGMVAVAGTTSQASSVAAVVNQQSSVMTSVGEKLRMDASWARRGGSRAPNSTTADETCASMRSDPSIDLTALDGGAWFRSRVAREVATSGFNAENWTVTAVAQKMDATVDGTCAGGSRYDNDGILPDFYRVTVQVSPRAATLTRFPTLKTVSSSFDVNVANRVAGGALVIQSCKIEPQIDERLPVGRCDTGASSRMSVLPPAGAQINGSTLNCGGAVAADCQAFRCASPILTGCGIAGLGSNIDFVNVRTVPHTSGTYRIDGDPDNPVIRNIHKTGSLDRTGTGEFFALPIGRYKVQVSPPGGYELWDSHSVPASGWATVVGGAESHVVQMFRPVTRPGPLRVKIETQETDGPWWDGFPKLHDHYHGGARTLTLVPTPRGRSSEVGSTFNLPGSGDDSGTQTRYAVFRNLEPGLYAGYMSDPNLITQHDMVTDTGRAVGYFFVPQTGSIAIPVRNFEWHTTWCNPDNVDGSPYSTGTTYYHDVDRYRWVAYSPRPADPPYGESVYDHTDHYQWTAPSCSGGGGGPSGDGFGGGGGG